MVRAGVHTLPTPLEALAKSEVPKEGLMRAHSKEFVDGLFELSCLQPVDVGWHPKGFLKPLTGIMASIETVLSLAALSWELHRP